MIRLYAEICSGFRSVTRFKVSFQDSRVCPGNADIRSILMFVNPHSRARWKLSRNSAQVWIRPRSFSSLSFADWSPKLRRLIPAHL